MSEVYEFSLAKFNTEMSLDRFDNSIEVNCFSLAARLDAALTLKISFRKEKNDFKVKDVSLFNRGGMPGQSSHGYEFSSYWQGYFSLPYASSLGSALQNIEKSLNGETYDKESFSDKWLNFSEQFERWYRQNILEILVNQSDLYLKCF